MSDKAATFHAGPNNPSDSEGQSSDSPSSETVTDEVAQSDSSTLPIPEPSSEQRVYGPVPKPVKQPLIFDRVYHPEAKADTGSKFASPSFSISAPRSTSSPVNTMSSDPRGEQPSAPQQGEALQSSPVQASSTDSEPTTIAVESQCDAPSLNDLSEVDISEASRDELMVYHSELMGWIRELERALQDCQADFKSHLHQYAIQEQFLEQRTQEIGTLQELNATLNKEVDTQQKAHQRQTILVETLQAQLDSSQERVAQMERDFSQVQRRCSDQAQQLLQAEGLCRDLKSRLSRQQRHTMQFKSALEKSLAVSVNDSDYDLGDVDMDSMDSSGELFPRSKPVQPWSNPLDEAALNQALSGLDPAASIGPAPSTPPAVAKGNQLQLAFESPEDVEFRATQAKATSKAQMGYGNAAMGLAASQQRLGADDPVEPVFDPEQAEDLEASLKEESESILKGAMLTPKAVTQVDVVTDNAMPLGTHGVAFVPPIKPVLPEDAKADLSLDSVLAGQKELASTPVSHNVQASQAAGTVKKRATSLAGIDLPSFPKP